MASTSRLLSLPLEIRTLIYSHIFQSPISHVLIEQDRSNNNKPTFRIVCADAPEWSLSLAPLLTCRQLYFETRHLLYTLNTVDLQLWHNRDIYSKKYDPVKLSQSPYIVHAHFPTAAALDVQIVDVKKTLELAVRWGQTTLPHIRLDDRHNGLQRLLPTGVRVVVCDGRFSPQFVPVKVKRAGKREAWRRFRWNVREGWWYVFS